MRRTVRLGILLLLLGVLACQQESAGRVNDATVDAAPAPADMNDAGSRFDSGVDLQLPEGPVRGQEVGDLRVFRGIPYAAPPLASLRFRAPAPHPGWKRRRDATRFGLACPHSARNPLNPVGEQGEDCLNLNVWTHTHPTSDGSLRPVMVWLHGGGFVQGAGSALLYDGSALARTGDVVVVTLNYRLGALGFLATASLRDESSDRSVGNYGLLDQRAALAWVQRNIERFGGDPHKVTLFGHSSGASSICAHMAMPESRKFFHQAILQSAGCSGCALGLEDDPRSPGGTLSLGRTFVAAAGCAEERDALACLRERSVEELLAAQDAVPANLFGAHTLGPSADGVSLRADPYTVLAKDTDYAIPLIAGSTQRESALYATLEQMAQPEAARALTGDEAQAKALASVYPMTDYASEREAVATMITEYWYTCAALSASRLFAERDVPAFSYEFRGTVPSGLGEIGPVHGSDVPFTFGVFDNALNAGSDVSLFMPGDAERELSATIIRLWTQFARSGNPGGSPAFRDTRAGVYALQEEGVRMESTIADGRCDRLRELGLVPDSR